MYSKVKQTKKNPQKDVHPSYSHHLIIYRISAMSIAKKGPQNFNYERRREHFVGGSIRTIKLN